jgi:hypothetical protein
MLEYMDDCGVGDDEYMDEEGGVDRLPALEPEQTTRVIIGRRFFPIQQIIAPKITALLTRKHTHEKVPVCDI